MSVVTSATWSETWEFSLLADEYLSNGNQYEALSRTHARTSLAKFIFQICPTENRTRDLFSR